jgi:hypothetical protein
MNANPEFFIQPLPVARDSDGFWFHVDALNFDEGDDERYKAWLKIQGLVAAQDDQCGDANPSEGVNR